MLNRKELYFILLLVAAIAGSLFFYVLYNKKQAVVPEQSKETVALKEINRDDCDIINCPPMIFERIDDVQSSAKDSHAKVV